jgi:hypothetical protein
VTDTRKTVSTTVSADAILKKQMPSIQADLDAVAVERDYAMSRNEPFNGGIVGLRELGYGLGSCQWSTLRWWSGLVGCENSRQARFVVISFYINEIPNGGVS